MTANPNIKEMRDKESQEWFKKRRKILDTSDAGHNTVEYYDRSLGDNSQATKEPPPCPDLTKTEISTELIVKQFISGIKIQKEKTSTSLSGRHLGHYKAIIRDGNLTQIFTTKSAPPLQYGFVPKQWTTTIQVVLSKEKGTPKLTRLRKIHILEADYNLILRTIWGRQMI